MTLLRLQDVELSVGRPHPLLEDVQLTLGEGERVCVLGRNGAGKSTLMKLLAGEMEPDAGTVQRRRGLRVARLPQEVPAGTAGRVYDVVAQAVGTQGELLAAFHRLSHAAESPEALEEMGRVQAALDAQGGWDAGRRVDEVLTRLDLSPEADFAALSGGMKRRVLLARTLAGAPDVLLLDEPTNHLDIENITWLEGFLREFPGSVVFVTHDRSFLRALATRILEIDRGRVTSWPGDYDDYLRRRDERMHAEEKEQARLDAKLAREEAWIRQGIKARRTRNMGRVRELRALREQVAARRGEEGRVRLEAADAGRSGKRVIQAKHVSFAWDGHPVVRDFSTTVQRRDRIGIVGRNGSGKTTLLRLLLGDLEPQEGTVQAGTKLEVAYFDQQRGRLDEDATLVENLSGGKEYVELGGGRRRHVMSYLQDFLFTPDRARTPITELSGGERSRLLLALLFSRPSNVLVMDEPTNDLDLETLELLEELVADYDGTLLLVSHDRTFLDHTVARLFVLPGDGRVQEEVGGVSDWLERTRRRETAAEGRSSAAGAASSRSQAPAARAKPAPARRGLGTKEKRELEALPERIERLEARVAELGEALADPAIWQGGAECRAGGGATDPRALRDELATVQAELDTAYGRWEELEARSTG